MEGCEEGAIVEEREGEREEGAVRGEYDRRTRKVEGVRGGVDIGSI